MKEALKLLGQVTGWGDMVRVVMGYDEIRAFVGPDETRGTGRFVYLCAATICGGGDERIQGEGSTPVGAILDCACKVIEEYKRREQHYRERRRRAEAALIESELTR